jgi:hypothetical protein
MKKTNPKDTAMTDIININLFISTDRGVGAD